MGLDTVLKGDYNGISTQVVRVLTKEKAMEQRQKDLLAEIIRCYVKSALPIGSRFLEEKCGLGVSSATLRNEMATLEKEGYLTHPHPSAGRIPTEKGYRFFLDNFAKAGKISAKELKLLTDFYRKVKILPWENRIRELAKKLAEISRNAVVVGFSPDSFYYTGLSNLFSQPEFKDPDVVYDLGLVIDHLDQVMAKMFGKINATTVRLGSDNPFGEQTSVILTPWRSQEGLMGILGPMRMDYEKNIGLLKFIEDNI